MEVATWHGSGRCLCCEHPQSPHGIAGSGLKAVRVLRVGLRNLPWHSRPSVGTWLRSAPARRDVQAEPCMVSSGNAATGCQTTQSVATNDVWHLKASTATWLQPKPRPSTLSGRTLQRQVPPQMWCVTLEDLDAFVAIVRKAYNDDSIPNGTGERYNPYHDDPLIGPNMHAVNQHVIIPKTLAAGGMSWALMCHPTGLPVGTSASSFFVTHSWAEGIFEFHRRVTRSWPSGADCMWCCFLANPQAWRKNELQELLGGDPLRDSPFAVALRAARQLLVVPNSTESIYSRLWCVAEAKLAIDLDIPVDLATDADATQQSSMDKVSISSQSRGLNILEMSIRDVSSYRKGLTARHAASRDLVTDFETVQNARCSDLEDERRIREAIKGEEDQIDELIQVLREQGHFYPEIDDDDCFDEPVEPSASKSGSLGASRCRISPAACRFSNSNFKDALLLEIAALTAVSQN